MREVPGRQALFDGVSLQAVGQSQKGESLGQKRVGKDLVEVVVVVVQVAMNTNAVVEDKGSLERDVAHEWAHSQDRDFCR
jgi:hypothetical protein